MPAVKEILPEPEKGPQNPHPTGLGPRMIKLLSKVQRYSAYSFQVFACLHLSGVILAPIVSPGLGNSTISVARTIYQSYLGEPLLVYASAGLHITSGVILHIRRIIKRRQAGKQWTYFTSVIQKSGVITSILLMGHFLAFRGGAVANLDADSSMLGLEYVRWVMSQASASGLSMLMLVTAFTHHAVLGFNTWLRMGLRPRTRNGIVMGTTLLALISLIRVRGMPLPTGWQVEYFKKAHALVSRCGPFF